MKNAEVGQAVLAGRKLVVGTFQDWEAVDRPKKDNPNELNTFATSFVLVGREVVSVTEFAPDGKKAKDLVRPPFKQGDRVVIEFRDWQNTKYGTRAGGKIEALQG